MTDFSDAYESAYTIMLNLNRSREISLWSRLLSAAIIWFLKIYENGTYCTFPHAIEFLNRPYAQKFPSSPPMMSWRTTFCPLWMRGRVEHKTICRDRLLRQRYRSYV